MRITCYMLVLALVSSAICNAQNVFCMGGDMGHLTADERVACQSQMMAVRDLTNRYRGLHDWHFVVVCGEASWRDYSSFAHERTNYLSHAVADIDQAERVIFLRGTALSSQRSMLPDPRILEAITQLEVEDKRTTAKISNRE